MRYLGVNSRIYIYTLAILTSVWISCWISGINHQELFTSFICAPQQILHQWTVTWYRHWFVATKTLAENSDSCTLSESVDIIDPKLRVVSHRISCPCFNGNNSKRKPDVQTVYILKSLLPVSLLQIFWRLFQFSTLTAKKMAFTKLANVLEKNSPPVSD